jgi:hypothetical protein
MTQHTDISQKKKKKKLNYATKLNIIPLYTKKNEVMVYFWWFIFIGSQWQ